uniref:Death ligand signal enhancer n=1 Tax=Culex pipiens TaxID=7175 RepID=A0A8D8BED6_CULPI
MWKYVSRRIRDVCDRTYNVLDVRRPFQRGGERFCAENFPDEGAGKDVGAVGGQGDGKGPSYCSLLNVLAPRKPLGLLAAGRNPGSGGSDGGEGFRRKDYCPPQHSWVGAITWTSAIICGWYTSQLICLYRRNHNWEGPKCLPFLISSAHNLPRNFPHCFLKEGPAGGHEASVEQKSQESDRQHHVTFFGVPVPTAKLSRLGEFDFERFSEVLQVVNHEEQSKAKTVQYGVQVAANGRDVPTVPEPQSPTVESAMENLVAVIGEIEYQLGVQNLEVGDYATAVSHLKLGTSHQHAGAAFNLGICFEQGFGVKKNARVAMECFHLASTLGHPQAMYNLGVYYARGLGGLRRSRSMAKRYFTAAADLGLEEAIVALGPAYRTRRDSMGASSSSSAASTPSGFGVPFEFKLNYDELEQYGFAGGDAFGKVVVDTPMEQHAELRLVSAMA